MYKRQDNIDGNFAEPEPEPEPEIEPEPEQINYALHSNVIDSTNSLLVLYATSSILMPAPRVSFNIRYKEGTSVYNYSDSGNSLYFFAKLANGIYTRVASDVSLSYDAAVSIDRYILSSSDFGKLIAGYPSNASSEFSDTLALYLSQDTSFTGEPTITVPTVAQDGGFNSSNLLVTMILNPVDSSSDDNVTGIPEPEPEPEPETEEDKKNKKKNTNKTKSLKHIKRSPRKTI